MVEITSSAPERVVNLCAAHGIPFWDVDWRTERCFRVTTTLPGLRRLREVTADTDADIRLLRKTGAPELWRRCRRRYVLLAAALVLPLLLALGSAFIWDFAVSGNDTVPTEEILQALERCGVRVGTRGVGLDQDDLRNRVLPLLPDVVYLAVNVRGCTAHVQVVERTRPPHLYRDSDVQNVLAARDGLITKIEALDGVTCVQVGDTVQAGQVLLGGVADSPRGCRYMRAHGRIRARTWYCWTVPVPLDVCEKTGEEGAVTRVAVDIGRQRIKLYAGADCFQFLCGISEICSRNKRHCISCIFHKNDCHIFRCFHSFFHNQNLCSFCNYIRHKFMAIHHCTADTDKKRALFYFPGIINHIFYFLVCTALKTCIFQLFQ